jgi:hypothetical protein
VELTVLVITENNMAQPILPEMQDISRQRDLAKLLLQKGMADNLQGQMVSGRYVGASPIQGIANVYSAYKGRQMANEADRKQQELAKMLREEGVKDIGLYMSALQGKPESVTYSAEDVGPSMNVTPATGPDYNKALSIALGSRSPMVQSLGAQTIGEMTKPQKLAEGEQFVRFNPNTNKYETIASGAEKFRAPLQVDTGTTIEFRDPKDPTKVLQVVPKSQAGQVVEREDGTYLVDTRTGQARPVMGQQGQQLVGGKPLTETQSNATAFGMRAVESNKILKDIEDSGTRTTGGIRSVVAGTLGAIPLVGENLSDTAKSALNFTASEKQQQTDQARRNFVTAVLRKESGAAISPTEFANEEKKYFPQIGDGEKVIKQKQEARDLAIKALEVQAGPTGSKSIRAQQNLQLTPQDQEALNWANSNPNDPRSVQIKQRLGK